MTPERGVGLACGTEKDSVVAACVEVRLDRSKGRIEVTEICEAFECGPILNPANLLSQVQGCIVMALGGALSEEVEFRDGKILNPRFSRYRVPRFRDVPRIDVHLVENRDIPPAGGGETPIIAAAPAIANADLRGHRGAPPLDAPARRRAAQSLTPTPGPASAGPRRRPRRLLPAPRPAVSRTRP